MELIHAALGYGLVIVVTLYAAVALITWHTARSLSSMRWLLVFAAVAMAIQAVQGLTLVATGHRPADWLHIVYAVLPVVLLIGSHIISVAMRPENARLAIAAAATVSTLLLLRAAATG